MRFRNMVLPFILSVFSSSLFAQNDSCPLQTAQAWQQFLDTTADRPEWVETCEDSVCDAKFFAYVDKNVHKVLEKCRSYLDSHQELNSCTQNLQRFLPAWMDQHNSSSYGFNVDNHTYLSAQEGPDKPPGMMKIPDAIATALPDQKKVQEVARMNGWKYLTHDSALTGIRTFIYIPDPQGRFDQWMLLNLRSVDQKNISKSTPVSMVAVQKKTASGEDLPQIRLHFRDYTLEEVASHPHLELNETANGKCYSCHANGMRQLIPRRTAVLEAKPVKGEAWFGRDAPDFSYHRLVEFNKIIRRYGTVDWDHKIIPADHGPMLGETQGCTSCHNGVSRGRLTVSTSVGQLNQKLVKELSMPPDGRVLRWLERSEMKNPPLSGNEAAEFKGMIHHGRLVMASFLESRFPELKKWLQEKPCMENTNGMPVSSR